MVEGVYPVLRSSGNGRFLLRDQQATPFCAESELVAGFHSEYSGMKFGLFFVGEYLGITLISAMIVTLFLGDGEDRSCRPSSGSPSRPFCS